MDDERAQRPSFGINTPFSAAAVVLMMGKALVDIFIDDKNQWLRVTDGSACRWSRC